MLTYPIPPQNLKGCWTVFDTNTVQVLRDGRNRLMIHRDWPMADGSAVTLPPDVAYLLEITDPRPLSGTDYDPATEKVVDNGITYDVANNEARRTWSIAALTQDELDYLAAQAARQAELDQAKGFYLDLKNGVGTQLERLVRCEKVLAFMLKRAYME